MFMGGLSFRLWVEYKIAIASRPLLRPVQYQPLPPDRTFLNADLSSVFSSEELFYDARASLLKEEEDFVEVDLQSMKVRLYEEGEKSMELTVISKGREGSWWETPTGLYTALQKEQNHFSSIGKVWMPWSIQFYGNFFIHGWPYYDDGSPVAEGYSGGCVRMSDEDAEKVYNFVSRGTPILVLDTETRPPFRAPLAGAEASIGAPVVTADAAVVTDLDTGEVILGKGASEVLPIASLTKLMTATVASELLYLGRSVTIDPSDLKDEIQSVPFTPYSRHLSFDLLYPILLQSSNGASRAIASSLVNEEFFVDQMNAKAGTLGMTNTRFQDPAGVGGENQSTLRDMAKLARYMLEKRKFLFDISRGQNYEVFGSVEYADLRNYNEFANDRNLLGVKNGETDIAGQTFLGVWEMKDRKGVDRRIMIGVLGSEDRFRDVTAIRGWLSGQFGLQ